MEMPIQPVRFDWIEVNYAFLRIVNDHNANKLLYQDQAIFRGMTEADFLCGKLTRAAQELIDYKLDHNYPWKEIHRILRGYCKAYCENLTGFWPREAKNAGMLETNFFAISVSALIALAIDCKDFESWNLCKNAASFD